MSSFIAMHPILLWTDLLVYLLLFASILFVIWARKLEHWREPFSRVTQKKLAMVSLVILLAYSVVGVLDSIHFKVTYESPGNISVVSVQSLLDLLVSPLGKQDEKTYSAPFSLYSSAKEMEVINGKLATFYPRLKFAGSHLQSPSEKMQDISRKVFAAIFWGIMTSLVFSFIFISLYAYKEHLQPIMAVKKIILSQTKVAWREILLTATFVITLVFFIKWLSPYYHILGTNKIGADILYETIKSIRTGLIIGTLTTLVILPFAVLLGTEAGYFGGWRDDIIQYVYTTLSSIPGVLLISASVLSLQIFIASHSYLFPTLESRADARLIALCFILGVTSWTSLCRLLRAETLKLREMDYVKAAVALGVRHFRIIWRHIIPNVMHIILITIVLDFSALVLAEAVLSYVGVGVDPTTPSWGNMINSARLDLAREPVVWWPLFAAFVFMFILVLSANLFADAVRDAFDPRSRNES